MSQLITAAGHWIGEPDIFEVVISTGSWSDDSLDDQVFFYTDNETVRAGDILPIDTGFQITEIFKETANA